MDSGWKARLAMWRAYNQWEDEHLRSRPVDFEEALAWMWDAHQLAARLSPRWDSRETAEEHWQHLADVRSALARARLSG